MAHAWLHNRLRLFSQYAGAYLAALPFGVVYLSLVYAGVSERLAITIVVLPGIVVAYYVWGFIGKRYAIKVSVRSDVPMSVDTRTQYALEDQFGFTGAIAVAVFVVCVAGSQATYPSSLPLATGTSDTQAS